MYYYYVPQVYPYVNYYPVYDMSRQFELYRQQQLQQIPNTANPNQQPTTSRTKTIFNDMAVFKCILW